MSETPEKTERPSLRKQPDAPAPDAPKKDTTSDGTRPPTANYAAIALVVAGVVGLIATALLLTVKDWIYSSAEDTNAKLDADKRQTVAEVHSQVDKSLITQLVIAGVALLLLLFIARGIFQGRYWARWVTVGLYAFASLTGAGIGGVSYLLVIGYSAPLAYKIPAFISGLAFLAAVVLVNLKPTVAYLYLTKPQRPGGATPRPSLFGGGRQRAGLAGPGGRAAASRAAQNARTAPARSEAVDNRPPGASKARAKVRSDAEAVARGADLARSRAKASKSRRSE